MTTRLPPELIELDTVSLRRWDLAWAAALQDAVSASLEELRPFMPWATDDHGVDQSAVYIEQSVRQWDDGENWNYAIVSPGGQVIGSVGLMSRMGPGVLEIGYWVHSAYAGRGIATAVAKALATVGLAAPGIGCVAIKHDVANVASGRVAEKAGFTCVGEQQREIGAPGQTGVELVWERHAESVR